MIVDKPLTIEQIKAFNIANVEELKVVAFFNQNNNNNEMNKKEVKEPEPEESLHKIIMPKNRIISENLPKDTTQNGIICKNKKCKYVFAYEQNDPYDQKKEEFFECPKCSTVTSKKDYLNTLNKT